MVKMFLRLGALLCALVAPAFAHAQSAVQQVGPVTPAHAGVWLGNGQIADETQVPNWLSGEMDNNFGSSPGEILCRATAQWQSLPPGTNGQYLISGGGSCPAWTTTTPGATPTSFTRAQIPTENIGANQTISVIGYATANDLGYGAVYTSTNCTSTGWGAIQDAGGTWFCLLSASGPVSSGATSYSNPGWFGAVGNNGATLITASDVAAHPEWRGTYGYATFTGTWTGTGNNGDPPILTVACPCTGNIAVGQLVQASGVTTRTVVALGSGTGGAGTYILSGPQGAGASGGVVGPLPANSGDTWDTVGTNEANLYAFAGNSTPGNIIWNSATGRQARNRILFIPSANYGLNEQILTAATDATIQFASNSACWDWLGNPGQTMWYMNSASFLYVALPCIEGGVRPQPGQAAPLWNLNHDGSAIGNDTQQVTILQPLFSVLPNAQGLAIATAGGGAQGSTIYLIQPEFIGSTPPDYCMWANGSNAISIHILGGDFQGCNKNAIKNSAASVFVDGTTFEDQNGGGNGGVTLSAPMSNQFTLGGADINTTASGGGASGVNHYSNVRGESTIGPICNLAQCIVDNWQEVGGDIQGGWFANFPLQRGYTAGGAISTGTGGFIAVDDGSPASVGQGNGGWGIVGAGSNDCTINDPTQSWTTNQFAGMTLFFRFSNGFIFHQTAAITGNTATSVTISPCFTTGTVVVGDTYHIGGQTGATAPSWSSASAGHELVPAPSDVNGFNTVAGSNLVLENGASPLSVNDYLVVWGADQVQNLSNTFPTALIGKVTAICNDAGCGTIATGTISISSFTATITCPCTGTFSPGGVIAGSGITANTKIIGQSSGTPGGAGVYFVGTSQTVSPTSVSETVPSGWHIATLDREAGINVAFGGGYYGTPIADNNFEWLALATPSMSGIANLNNSSSPGFMSFANGMGNSCSFRTDCDTGASGVTTIAAQSKTFHRDWGPRERAVFSQTNGGGTIDLTNAFNSANDITISAVFSATLNAPVPTTASMARTVTLRFAGGASPATITFGSNFNSAGPLVTDGNASSIYVVVFHTTGTAWNEVSRSGPNRGFGAAPAFSPLRVSGNWYGSLGRYTASFATASTTTAYFSPLILYRAVTIQALGAFVVTGQAASDIQLGVYPDNGSGTPLLTGGPLISTGNIVTTSSATNVSGSVTATTLQPGLYWVDTQSNNTGLILLGFTADGTTQLQALIGASSQSGLVGGSSTIVNGYTLTGQTFGTFPTSGSPTSTNAINGAAIEYQSQ